ncbi:MAG: transketolase [Candidatus Diapherotrites archaeon]
MDAKQLEAKAKGIRADILRMTTAANSGHPGGSLSATDVIVALYYGGILNHDPKKPRLDERDKFVLSKGHCAPALYAVLADQGYFSKKELQNLRKIGGMLQGHPDRLKTPGIEATTGSLGQGLSVAVGMALAARMDKKQSKVYCMLGCGESQEGQVWEAAMFAGHHKLDNLIGITDYNRMQIDGKMEEVIDLEPLKDKWKAFNWNVLEIDGHNFAQIIDALENARQFKGKPTMIIAKTVKGKGVSFMECIVDYHGKCLSKEELGKALNELGAE